MTDNKHAHHDTQGQGHSSRPDPAHRNPANQGGQGSLGNSPQGDPADAEGRNAGRAANDSAKPHYTQPLNPSHPGAPQPSGGLHSRPEPTGNRPNVKH